MPAVPVLVGGAAIPSADQLPVELAGLAQRQAVVVRDESFHGDVELLLQSLRGEQPGTRTSQSRLLAVGLVLAIILGAAASWWIWGRPEDQGGDELTGCPDPSEAGWNDITLNDRPSAVVEDEAGSVRLTATAVSWRADGPGGWQVAVTTEMENNTSSDRQHTENYYQSIVVARRPFDAACFDTPGEEYTGPGQVADGHVGFLVTCAPTGGIDLVLNSPRSYEGTTLRLTTATAEGCDTRSS